MTPAEGTNIKLRVITDNNVAVEGFKSEWGFACMIGEDILFDTGETAEVLLHNLSQAGIGPEQIKTVVLSHRDEDHTGGLFGLLERNPSVRVVLHSDFREEFIGQVRGCGAEVISAEGFTEVAPDIFVTGQYPTREQALVIKTEAGLVVVTGCAHPDPVAILQNIHRNMPGPIELVFGGFHLMEQTRDETLATIETFRNLGVRRAGACHCTGKKAIQVFREKYGDDFVEIGAGTVIEV